MFIKSIDTMMQSRTTCLGWNQLTLEQINNDTNICALHGVTHITNCVTFDYPEYLKRWTDSIRLTGKSVWYRGIWNRWTGLHDEPDDMTPEQYLEQTDAFIRANPDLFRTGDIFDAVPEPNEGKHWARVGGSGWNWSPAPPNPTTIAFNKFCRDMKLKVEQAFRDIGVYGVQTNVMSQLHFQAMRVLDAETVDAYGLITIDGYPEGRDPITPEAATRARIAEFEQVHHKWNVPILIGEMGFQLGGGIPDEEQRAVLAATLEAISQLPYIVGLNYWHGTGAHDGVRIFKGDRNGWTPRPAAQELLRYFQRR